MQAEADVLDLCETACDVAADFLGLSDDQADTLNCRLDALLELQNCFRGCSGSRCVRRNQGGKTRGATEDSTFQRSVNFTSMLSPLRLIMPVSERTEDPSAEVPQDLNLLWQTGLDSQA